MKLPKLSVLDQSPVPSGSTGSQALANTVELAQLADRLGYARYWLAEHHGTPTLAGASPEVLIATIAGRTSRIRVGSGGVMLPHYSPLKVAETFSILSGLNPGRIDLAIGRASGTNPITTLALQRDRTRAAPDDFPEQLGELMAYLYGFEEPHPFDKIPAHPGGPELPELWLLGSSHQSGLWAGELGLPYAFADFINPEGGFVAELYRERFIPSSRLEMPRVCVAVSAICAETDDEAERLAASYRALWVQIRKGASTEVPSVEEALEFLASEGPPRREPPQRILLGSPKKVAMGLRDVAAEYAAEEVMVVTITHDHRARMRSYELIAEAFASLVGAQPSVGGW
jgi:luciferase family oxidoreductase group 1